MLPEIVKFVIALLRRKRGEQAVAVINKLYLFSVGMECFSSGWKQLAKNRPL